jgi:hypothetical protein
MDQRELDPTGLRRIAEGDVRPRDIRWLVQVDVECAALEERFAGNHQRRLRRVVLLRLLPGGRGRRSYCCDRCTIQWSPDSY